MTDFAGDRRVLEALWFMLSIEDEFLRVSWSSGAGLAPLDLPEPTSDEELTQLLVAEFDAELLTPHRRKLVLAGEEDPDLPRDELVHFDFEPGDLAGWLRMVQRMSEDRDVLLSAATRRRREFGTCGQANVVWARVETKKDAQALAKFRPLPTIVLREGSTCRRVALWSLRRPLKYEWLIRANRRIAHRLFGPKKWADAEFAFPAPGSCLRVGRSRPVPIHVERFEPTIFHAREVVGKLKDAPDPNAWRESNAA